MEAITNSHIALALAGLVGLAWLLWKRYGERKRRMRLSRATTVEKFKALGAYNEESLEFLAQLIGRSGIGDATALPEAAINAKTGDELEHLPHTVRLAETEEVLFTTVEGLLAKTGIKPEEVDIIVTSCSCFAPTPSMAAMIMNRFKMPQTTRTFSLAGMGCASSLICVDMCKDLLKARPNQVALIVNHENLTSNMYAGNDRSMLITNCLFRVGGGAALMTNRPKDYARAKYELTHTLRTQLAAQDDAFSCMGEGQDVEGRYGVYLRKNVIEVAGRALKTNLTALAPAVMPLALKLRVAIDKEYSVDLGAVFDHFLLHTGGRGVLESLESAMKLTPKQMAPSFATLKQFGNTSAASTWYILANIEHNAGIRKGDRVWQLGFGGGFKCNSAVWVARKTFVDGHLCWTEA